MLTGKKHQAGTLTPSHEHYLRAIWEVRSRRGYARLTDVARELGVAPATLSVGLRPLLAKGLLAHDEARFLVLSAEGERVAREVHHRFAVLRTFLRDVLRVPSARAEEEACRIEHDISAETAERFVDLLKLLQEDGEMNRQFHQRFDSYRRECSPSGLCSTCGLSCLTPPPR